MVWGRGSSKKPPKQPKKQAKEVRGKEAGETKSEGHGKDALITGIIKKSGKK